MATAVSCQCMRTNYTTVAMERKDGHTFERVKKLLLGAVDTVLEIATGTNEKRTESSLSVGTAGQSMMLITQIAQGSISRKRSPSPVGSTITLIQGVWSASQDILLTLLRITCRGSGLTPTVVDPGSCSVCDSPLFMLTGSRIAHSVCLGSL